MLTWNSGPTYFQQSCWQVQLHPFISGFHYWGLSWEEWLSLGAQSSPLRSGILDRATTGCFSDMQLQNRGDIS